MLWDPVFLFTFSLVRSPFFLFLHRRLRLRRDFHLQTVQISLFLTSHVNTIVKYFFRKLRKLKLNLHEIYISKIIGRVSAWYYENANEKKLLLYNKYSSNTEKFSLQQRANRKMCIITSQTVQ